MNTQCCRPLKVPSGQIGSAWEWHHWIGLEKDINCVTLRYDQLLYVFDFLISLLNIWKDLKVLSHLIQKLTQPPACSDHGFYKILFSYWLAHFYLMKKSAKVLHYFNLDCGMLEFFKYSPHKPKSKEQLLTLPHFWSTIRGKRSRFVLLQTVIRTSRRIRWIFVWSGSELWGLFKYSKVK
jgi:hypothetical protein